MIKPEDHVIRKCIVLTAVLLISVTCSIYAQQPTEQEARIVDGIMAVVNDEIILRSEVMMMVRETMRRQNITPNQLTDEKFDELIEETLNTLIIAKVEVAKAMEDTSITVSDREIDDEVENRMQNLISEIGSEAAVEQAFGNSVRRIRELIREQASDQLYIQKIRGQRMMSIDIARPEIEGFYETYKDSLPVQPDIYELSHILKAPKPSGPAADAKRAKIDSIRTAILNGADFAEMARQHSEDPGSRENGGAYDWVNFGSFVPEFEETVRALNPGQLSEVVQSSFGYHIIEVIEKQDTRFKSRHILVMVQATEDDEEALVDSLNILRDLALTGEDFNEMSATYSDEDQVKKDRGRVGAYSVEQLQQIDPEIAKVAVTLKEGEISKPFKSEFGYHVLKVDRFIPSHRMNLEVDYERLKDIAEQRKRQSTYQDWLNNAKLEMFIDIKESKIPDSLLTEIK